MSKTKSKRTAEVIFALKRFPESAEAIEQAYKDKIAFDEALKKLRAIYLGAESKDEEAIRELLREISDINVKLKTIEPNLYTAVCCHKRFVNKRATCLAKAKKKLDEETFQNAEILLEQADVIAEKCDPFGFTYNKACTLLSKVVLTMNEVKRKIHLLEQVSKHPKKHFRSLYKNLGI